MIMLFCDFNELTIKPPCISALSLFIYTTYLFFNLPIVYCILLSFAALNSNPEISGKCKTQRHPRLLTKSATTL